MAATGLFRWQLSSLGIIWVLSCWKEDELTVNKSLFLFVGNLCLLGLPGIPPKPPEHPE